MAENNQEKPKDINEEAMQIIIYAGDARLFIMKSIDAISKNQFADAGKNIALAQEKIKSAHILHTKAIQDDARGNGKPYSMLFTHAQDTLMTIRSEMLLTEKLFNVFENINMRFNQLEK